jgi:ATP-dependent helicase/nuclease subunit A
MLVQSSGRPARELARPEDWETYLARELPYKEAEYQRLLYVAATRAKRELVISLCERSREKSPWLPFYDHLDACATEVVIEASPPPARHREAPSAADILAEANATEQYRLELGGESYQIESVTSRVKGGDDEIMIASGGRGADWGSAVHAALEAAGKGAAGKELRDAARTILLDNELPTDAGGEPEDLDELLRLVEGVLASEVWERARQAEHLLLEVPFSVASAPRAVAGHATAGKPAQDGRETDDTSPPEPIDVIEGIIDLAFKEPDGWVLADYKTDSVDDHAVLERRLERYRDQVDLYAFCWQNLSGEPVKERRILWLGMERPDEVW